MEPTRDKGFEAFQPPKADEAKKKKSKDAHTHKTRYHHHKEKAGDKRMVPSGKPSYDLPDELWREIAASGDRSVREGLRGTSNRLRKIANPVQISKKAQEKAQKEWRNLISNNWLSEVNRAKDRLSLKSVDWSPEISGVGMKNPSGNKSDLPIPLASLAQVSNPKQISLIRLAILDSQKEEDKHDVAEALYILENIRDNIDALEWAASMMTNNQFLVSLEFDENGNFVKTNVPNSTEYNPNHLYIDIVRSENKRNINPVIQFYPNDDPKLPDWRITQSDFVPKPVPDSCKATAALTVDMLNVIEANARILLTLEPNNRFFDTKEFIFHGPLSKEDLLKREADPDRKPPDFSRLLGELPETGAKA